MIDIRWNLAHVSVIAAPSPQEGSQARRNFNALKDHAKQMSRPGRVPTESIIEGLVALVLVLVVVQVARALLREPAAAAEPAPPPPDPTPKSNRRFVTRAPRRPVVAPFPDMEPGTWGWLAVCGVDADTFRCEVVGHGDGSATLNLEGEVPPIPESTLAWIVLEDAGASRQIQQVTTGPMEETDAVWRIEIWPAPDRVGLRLSPGVRLGVNRAGTVEVVRGGQRTSIQGTVTEFGIDGLTFDPSTPLNVGESVRVFFEPLSGAPDVDLECQVVRRINHSSGRRPAVLNLRMPVSDETMVTRMAIGAFLEAPESTPDIEPAEPATATGPGAPPTQA